MYGLLLAILLPIPGKTADSSWIRINQLGYIPYGNKVAVWCSKDSVSVKTFQLINASTKKIAFSGSAGKAFGKYGPFKQTYRLDFSSFKTAGNYYLQAGGVKSPVFEIGNDVYKGAADFCLRYMRQQRSGFNPYLKDSCHTHDGYTLYGPMPDSTHVDVSGGWHDASDYLQYSTTSANATWHLLAAWRDFPASFGDEKMENGLDGKNGIPDVLDEAQWGLDWLSKMFPCRNIMFNQVGDDRDHMGMRIPKEDSFYGKGYERPVYFVSGMPQQRGKFMNNTTGTASTAGKFSSAFALAEYLNSTDSVFRKLNPGRHYYAKAMDALQYALEKPGVMQTASVRSPYIYAEDNWVDDVELASISVHKMVNHTDSGSGNAFYMTKSLDYAKKEKITPWLGTDTASHYQWYPFINLGHYELAKELRSKKFGTTPEAGNSRNFVTGFWNNFDTITGYYKKGIEAVWNKARQNAFYRGVPFIWCSNNLTTSFAIQCYWYRQLTGDKTFSPLEQANFDWLFGCNPWGTSMVYGLPSWGDTPVDPHSAFTHLKNYPIDGGLVDGPVYGNIYRNLIGITLKDPDEYATFQSDLVVYHDDYGDYSTNEPTMDGTASLIYLLAAKENEVGQKEPKFRSQSELQELQRTSAKRFTYSHGGIIRGDSIQKKIALVFTGHEYAEGGDFIVQALKEQKAKASFFFTGVFYSNSERIPLINKLIRDGHLLGNHSRYHRLYCDWNNRDSLLVNHDEFDADLLGTLESLAFLAPKLESPNSLSNSFSAYFLPPYEWYNDTIAAWTKQRNMQLVNFTPGTLSNADYTTLKDKNYRSSETIYNSIINYEKFHSAGLNGFILLMHIGAGPDRTDKFYNRLPELLKYLKAKGYQLQTIDELLKAE